MAPTIEGGAIKGAALREFIRWYAKREGPERLGAVIERMPEQHRKRLDPDSAALGVMVDMKIMPVKTAITSKTTMTDLVRVALYVIIFSRLLANVVPESRIW